ncbi:MAG: stage V sporulation protein AC [Oscillospiraceae bacterium]|nr:stage V sporulation protein AC [Oscillospiraceae bacterium]
MPLTPKQYEKLSQKAAPPSKTARNCAKAFLIGGTVCALGQGILLWAGRMGLDQKSAGAVTSVSLIFLAALLTGIGCFDKIAKHAGAGTLVPITGFANAMVSPALEFQNEGFILGVGAKMFSIAGPVLLYGNAAAVLYGVIYWLAATFF